MLGLQLWHGGQLFLPRPGGEARQGERFGAMAGHGRVDADQEVTGGGKICHRQSGCGAGDVLEEDHRATALSPHLELVGLSVLGPAGAD